MLSNGVYSCTHNHANQLTGVQRQRPDRRGCEMGRIATYMV